ncbi:MAG: cobalamin-binding protein [Candidatus Dadabacteria bacterium]|nr:MAG: cobalamin-binding protein [Candidatus Dadabacteria bacterium]
MTLLAIWLMMPALVVAAPQRIVSLTPSVTETLYAVGAGARVVGTTEFCDYPPAATRTAKVGGGLPKTVSIEAIVALRPDLVIAGADGQQPLVEQLERLGIQTLYLPTIGVEDALRMISVVGEEVGRTADARRVVDLNRKVIAGVAARVAGQARVRVFYQVWSEPLMTAGPHTFLSELIQLAGGQNIFEDVREDWPRVAPEQVVARAPEVILGADYEGANLSVEALRARPGWAAIPAVRHGRVVRLDGQRISRPGPRIGQSLLLVAEALHPEVDFSDLWAVANAVFQQP